MEYVVLSSEFEVIQKAMIKKKRLHIKKQLEEAAKVMFFEYDTDQELTAFTVLDYETFYEVTDLSDYWPVNSEQN